VVLADAQHLGDLREREGQAVGEGEGGLRHRPTPNARSYRPASDRARWRRRWAFWRRLEGRLVAKLLTSTRK